MGPSTRKLVTLCTMVVNRYDLLADCLRTAAGGSLVPDHLELIHNGKDGAALARAMESWPGTYNVTIPEQPLGVAESWNVFLQRVPEERIITNDDIVFAMDSIEKMVATPGDFVSPIAGTNAFSCFIIRDTCVNAVGPFDESISPGYVYFEDCDYVNRMREAGIAITGVQCGVVHVGSATLIARSQDEVNEHNRRFLLAQANYLAKWGKLPTGVELQS